MHSIFQVKTLENKENIAKLKQMVEENPSDYEIQKELAFLYLDDGFLEEALKIFESLTKIFSQDADLTVSQYLAGMKDKYSKTEWDKVMSQYYN